MLFHQISINLTFKHIRVSWENIMAGMPTDVTAAAAPTQRRPAGRGEAARPRSLASSAGGREQYESRAWADACLRYCSRENSRGEALPASPHPKPLPILEGPPLFHWELAIYLAEDHYIYVSVKPSQ